METLTFAWENNEDRSRKEIGWVKQVSTDIPSHQVSQASFIVI